MNQTLYIFIDESGNFDFSPKGTKFFVLTAVSTTEPSFCREQFLDAKYELLKEGLCGEEFHATEDSQRVRNIMFGHIERIGRLSIDSVIAQKNKANPALYPPEIFYKLISQTLLKYIFQRYREHEQIDQIVIVLGSIFNSTKQGYILKSLKQYLKNTFAKPFRIYFHQACSDINCQIADYCGWAIYVNMTRNEPRPLFVIRPYVQSMFEIFESGVTEFYENK
ncbi:MAG: DUF3800 domain-containing protein [Patescibacteria group bacterium]